MSVQLTKHSLISIQNPDWQIEDLLLTLPSNTPLTSLLTSPSNTTFGSVSDVRCQDLSVKGFVINEEFVNESFFINIYQHFFINIYQHKRVLCTNHPSSSGPLLSVRIDKIWYNSLSFSLQESICFLSCPLPSHHYKTLWFYNRFL